VLVISAGEAGKLTARNLRQSGVATMLVTNRSAERARELAADLGAQAVPFARLEEHVTRADIVITSTASAQFVIDRPLIERVMALRANRPLLMIDIAVPRDINPAVREIAGAHLYDIDGLQGIAQANINLRRNELTQVEAIVDEAVIKFSDWLHSLEVVPTVSSLRTRAEATRLAELERTLSKTKMSAADRKRVEAMTAAIVKKLLHAPIARLKTPGEGERYDEATRALFDLDDEAAGE
jgi:glutamyl-tRNA reductase